MRISLPEGQQHAVALVAPCPGRGEEGSLAADRAAGARAVELALAAALGRDAPAALVRRRPGRPPLVLLGNGDSSVRAPHAISVAHVDGHAAALVAPPGWRIGVDLERVASVRDDFRRYFLSDSEHHELRHLPAASCWALKEAAWKALELGQSCAFRDLALGVDGGGSVRAVVHGGVAYDASAQLAEPWPGYVLAALWIAAPHAAGVAAEPAALRGMR